VQLRPAYTSFIIERQSLHEYELTAADWTLVETTIAFLQPFKEAIKRCEGDYVTLDKVQEHMDALREHFEDNDKVTRGQTALHQAVQPAGTPLIDTIASLITLEPIQRLYCFIQTNGRAISITLGHVTGGRLVLNVLGGSGQTTISKTSLLRLLITPSCLTLSNTEPRLLLSNAVAAMARTATNLSASFTRHRTCYLQTRHHCSGGLLHFNNGAIRSYRRWRLTCSLVRQ